MLLNLTGLEFSSFGTEFKILFQDARDRALQGSSEIRESPGLKKSTRKYPYLVID